VAFVAGQRVGETPVSAYEVSPGVHAVRIVAEGRRPFETSVAVQGGTEVRVDATLDPVDNEEWSWSDTGWTLVGAGAGTAAVGAVLAGLSIAEANRANSERDPALRERAERMNVAGWALAGVGAAGAVAGAVILLLEPEDESFTFGVTPMPEGAAVGLQGRF
jgi:hypothetical protein